MMFSEGNTQTAVQEEVGAWKKTGICANCMHSDSCCLSDPAAGPVYFCEEFDVGEPVMRMTAIQVKEEQSTASEGKFLGLCQNCESRETCMYAKPESGVWHCESYS